MLTRGGGPSTGVLQGLLGGIVFGVTFGLLLVPFLDRDCEPNVNVVISSRPKRDTAAQVPPPLLRPRYVSTELGLRKKLLVGIVVADSSAIGLHRVIRLNQTLTHNVDKVIFFVNGTTGEDVNGTMQRLRALGLTGIVPIEVKVQNWTADGDNVHSVAHHVSLRALKYFGDKFLNGFDYFYVTLDQGYVSGHNLMESLKRISVREEVLWGIPEGSGVNGGPQPPPSSCKLESGFVVSRNVLAGFWNRLGRCWSLAALRDKLGGNLPACLDYLAPGRVCRTEIQNQIYKVAGTVSGTSQDRNLIFVGPISEPNEILKIHQTFVRNRKLEIDSEIAQFRQLMLQLQPKVPEKWRRLTWPIGLPAPIKPKTRFDVNRWTYFTSSTIYFQNGDSAATSLDPDGLDHRDIANVLTLGAKRLFQQERMKGMSTMDGDDVPKFQYGYKRFSPTRGMEYNLHFDHKGTHLRVEGLRPLTGMIEIVPVPFTTEAKRLFLILPITRLNMAHLSRFLDFWSMTRTDSRQDGTNLVIAIIQGLTTSNSILLSPAEAERLGHLVTSRRSNVTSPAKVGTPIIVNLGTKTHVQLGILEDFWKRGLLAMSTVVVFLEPNVEFKDEFLNRVRMNTIPGYQVFCSIPFVEYHPKVSHVTQFQLNKENGYFNSKEFRIMSFYYADYLNARKSLGVDMSKYIRKVDDRETLVDIFLHGTTLHVLRATDPNLNLRSMNGTFKEEDCQVDMEYCTEPLVGSKTQLAKIVMATGGLD